MEYTEILIFMLAGLIGGFLSGMLGVGGGMVFVPVIQQVLINHSIGGDFVSYTLANSLMLVFIVGISGTIRQLKFGNTHLFSAFITGISAIVSSFTVTLFINKYKWINPETFNIIFACILIVTALRMVMSGNKHESSLGSIHIPSAGKFVPAGFFAGFITSLSGLGGGIIMVPYFHRILKLPIKFSTGLSLSVIPIIALPMLIYYSIIRPSAAVYTGYQTGYIIWPVIIPIIGTAILASQYGVKFSQKLNSGAIKWVFITFIFVTLGKMFLFQ